MPKRTIKDAFFIFNDTYGRRIWAQRGETHDIPEGEDLARGDRLGVFTPDGSEPPAPPGTYIPAIELSWTPEEWNRWVDAGKINEIIAKLNDVADHERGRAAALIIQAEHGRGEKARSELLESLAKVADSSVSPSGGGENWETDISSLTDEELATWVRRNSAEAVLAAVGADPELAALVKEAEQAGHAREGLIVALDERAGLARNGQVATGDTPDNAGNTEGSHVVIPGTTSVNTPEPENVPKPGAQDVVALVTGNNIPTILELAGNDAETARALREAEESRGDDARKTLIEQLAKIEQDSGE